MTFNTEEIYVVVVVVVFQTHFSSFSDTCPFSEHHSAVIQLRNENKVSTEIDLAFAKCNCI